jgi:hypothetical protein
MVELITPYITELNLKVLLAVGGALASIAAGIWAVVIFFHKAITEREQKEFDRYRMLIKDLNVGEDGSAPFIDFQLAAVYQMRFYRKYYPRSLWMLNRLKLQWAANDAERVANSDAPKYALKHFEEIDETIIFIGHRKSILGCLIFGIPNLFYIFYRKKTSLSKLK